MFGVRPSLVQEAQSMRQMIVQPSLNGLTLRDVKRVERHVESLGALFDLIPLGSVSSRVVYEDGRQIFATMEQTLMRRLSKMDCPSSI